jgi:hypothetical protein
MKPPHLSFHTTPAPRVSPAVSRVLRRRQKRRQALRQLRRLGISISRLRQQWGTLGYAGIDLAEVLLPTELRSWSLRG